MSRTVHVSMSIRGALSNREFGCFQRDDGTPMKPEEAFNELCDLLTQGYEVVPATKCDNFDPKKGCMGHETISE
jgi:hypothetical protein